MAETPKIRRTSMQELWGIVLITLGVLFSLAFFSYAPTDVSAVRVPPSNPPINIVGPAGAWFGFLTLMTFGVGALLIPLWCMIVGALMLFRPGHRIFQRCIWGLLVVAISSCIFQIHPHWTDNLTEKWNIAGISGGMLGWTAGEWLLAGMLGNTGANVLIVGLLAGCILMFAGMESIASFFHGTWKLVLLLHNRIAETRNARRDRLEKIALEERALEKEKARLEREVNKKKKKERAVKPEPEPEPEPEPSKEETPALVQPEPEPEPEPPPQNAEPAQRADTGDEFDGMSTTDQNVNYQLPPISLLKEAPAGHEKDIESDDSTTSRILKETLAEFGVECEIKNIVKGPVVTRYELLPAAGVRVERIAGLSNNLALSLKATSVRVRAPIPGKGLVGVEVPNTLSSKIYIREIIESEQWQTGKADLPLVLGKDVAGAPMVADLTQMPHLLIAGATGSGKTVCMNSVLTGLLMSKKPDEMKLMLVDPKIVEFSGYNNLPHLVVPVITDPKKVILGLRWAINEMEKRYKLFAQAGVRNIASFNNRSGKNSPVTPKDDEDIPDKVPYIVIAVDELADLMMVAKADVEYAITRLAQLSRAVGIHMIIATQRPSVNVITGTIKANFPARISFQVAQQTDSRTILDAKGAEKLLGRGDMLFMPPGSSKLIRAQGALTNDDETKAVVKFIKEQGTADYEVEIAEAMKSPSPAKMSLADDDADEELMEMAIAIIRESRRASTSSLQRHLKIGYNRAARLMDVLEERGVVGPPRGSEPREILIDLDVNMPLNGSAEAEDDSQQDSSAEEQQDGNGSANP